MKLDSTESEKVGHRERLRSRFLAGDAGAQTDEALLELLLSYSIPQKDTGPLATGLISELGSLSGVFLATYERLTQAHGVKSYSATLIKLVDFIRSHQAEAPRPEYNVTLDKVTQRSLFEMASDAPAMLPGIASSKRHPHAIHRQRTGIFGKAILEDAISMLPDLPDTESLDEVRRFLRANLHYSAVETRHRYSNYITRRMFPDGIADKTLRHFAGKYRSTQELRDVCFYRFCKAEPLMAEVASAQLIPNIGAGSLVRAQLRQYLSDRFPGAKSGGDCAKAVVDALAAGGIAKANPKSITFAYRNPLIPSFAFVLNSEFPATGMYDIAALEKNEAIRAMLWNPDQLVPALYEMRNQGLLSKVSEIDSVRQFTMKFTPEQMVDRLVGGIQAHK